MFVCSRFEEVRRETLEEVEVRVTVDNLVSEMCRDEHIWLAVCRFAKYTMTVLQQRWNTEKPHQFSTDETIGVG